MNCLKLIKMQWLPLKSTGKACMNSMNRYEQISFICIIYLIQGLFQFSFVISHIKFHKAMCSILSQKQGCLKSHFKIMRK